MGVHRDVYRGVHKGCVHRGVHRGRHPIEYAQPPTVKLGGMHTPLKVLIALVRFSGRAVASG